jgi:hypothetical protein
MISVVIHPAMFWRRAKKALTSEQKRLYEHHRTRLLSRHSCRLTPAPDPQLGRQCQLLGQAPGNNDPGMGIEHARRRPSCRSRGRAKIQENRKRQAEEERRAKIRALSSVATGKKVRTG